jgi:hypothetical protein
MAASIARLDFIREVADEWWYDFKKDTLSVVVTVEETYVVCLDGFWSRGDEVFNFHRPCAYENFVFVDPDALGDQQGIGRVEMRRWYRRERKRLRLLENADDWTDGEDLVD